ncbi:TPA: hypothetical protein ACG3PP_003806 [Clostridioides difficile]
MKNRIIILLMSLISLGATAPVVNADTVDSLTSKNAEAGMPIEISSEDVEQLHNMWPEDTNMPDEAIDKILIDKGEFTQTELDKIKVDYYNELKNDLNVSPNSTRAKYINGYNKYRTFTKNGKEYLYVYISGQTLAKIRNGANYTAALGGFLPSKFLGVATVAFSIAIMDQLDTIGVKYGIVMSYVKDKWVFQGATYTYRYEHWFYQT